MLIFLISNGELNLIRHGPINAYHLEFSITLDPLIQFSASNSLALIMKPGFSTKDVAIEYSGPGVGLDIVKTNITSLQGEVILNSSLVQRTTFQKKNDS